MRIKTYFSGTVEAALGLASRELGGDALLLTARPAGVASQHLGAYEVVFGVPGPAPTQRHLKDFLTDQDCHPALIDRVLRSLQGGDASDREVWCALRDSLTFQPWDPAQPCRLAFAGPAGAGKSATALKIAFQSEVPVTLVDADTRKVGSPIRRAAAIAGVECLAVAEPRDLSSLEQFRSDASLLIDLDGSLVGGPAETAKWADAFQTLPGLAVCLVLPATARTADLMLAVERYRAFRPARLILTRMDETSRAGGALSVCAFSGLPLVAFGTGPGITGGIEPGGEKRLLELMFQNQAAQGQAQAAAAGGHR